MPLDARSSPATTLCISCGLCCDGTVFSFVPLKDGEPPAQALAEGARWRDSPEKPAFLLPCHAFVGKCGIYEERPQVCRSFRCRVLRRAEAGEHTWERAHELVGLGKVRRDALRGAIIRATGEGRPENSLSAEMARVLDLRGEGESDAEFRRRMGEVLVTHAALRHLIREQFVLPKDRERGVKEPSTGELDAPLPMATGADPDGEPTPPEPAGPS